jgi:hypothetical protein
MILAVAKECSYKIVQADAMEILAKLTITTIITAVPTMPISFVREIIFIGMTLAGTSKIYIQVAPAGKHAVPDNV